jgi:hypothetical protein
LNITFDIDLIYINDEVKPTYKGNDLYPNLNKKSEVNPEEYAPF